MERPPVVFIIGGRNVLAPASHPVAGPDPRIQHQEAVNYTPQQYAPPTYNTQIPHSSDYRICLEPAAPTRSDFPGPDPRTQHYEAVIRKPPRYEPPTHNTQVPHSSQYWVYRESEDPALAGYESDFDGPAPARHSAFADPEDLALSDIEEEEESVPSVAGRAGHPERNAEVEAVAEHMNAAVLESIEGPDGFADFHESGTANNPVLIPSSPLGEIKCLPHSEAEQTESGSPSALSESRASPEGSASESQLNSAPGPISTESTLPRILTRPKITILPRRPLGGLSARMRSQLKFTIRVADDSICSSSLPAGSLSCEHLDHRDLKPIDDDPILKHIPSSRSQATRLFKLRKHRCDQSDDCRNLRFGQRAVATERGVSYTDFKFDWTVGTVGLHSNLVHAAGHAAGYDMVARAFRLEFRLRVNGEPGQMPMDYPIWVNITVWATIKRASVHSGNYTARQRRIFFDVPTDMRPHTQSEVAASRFASQGSGS